MLAVFLIGLFLPFLVPFYNRQVWKGVVSVFATIIYAWAFWGLLSFWTAITAMVAPSLIPLPTIVIWTLFMIDSILCGAALLVVPQIGDWDLFGGGRTPKGSFPLRMAGPFVLLTLLMAIVAQVAWMAIVSVGTKGTVEDKVDDPPFSSRGNLRMPSSNWSNRYTRFVAGSVRIGMSPSEVERVIGEPDDFFGSSSPGQRFLWVYSCADGEVTIHFSRTMYVDDIQESNTSR